MKPDHQKEPGDSSISFFAEMESGRQVPRAVYVDLEPTVIGKSFEKKICSTRHIIRHDRIFF